MTLINQSLLECVNVSLALRCPPANPDAHLRGPERDGLAYLNPGGGSMTNLPTSGWV